MVVLGFVNIVLKSCIGCNDGSLLYFIRALVGVVVMIVIFSEQIEGILKGLKLTRILFILFSSTSFIPLSHIMAVPQKQWAAVRTNSLLIRVPSH